MRPEICTPKRYRGKTMYALQLW
uniref:Uncharacterized protein n=1 Tax=Arundo donax TaxID=35708 RepID=A0A0A8Y8K9_ARUDO